MVSSKTRLWVILVIGLATVAAIGVAFNFSLDPDRYFRYSHIDYPAWSHPTAHVVMVCSIILLEGLAAVLILVGPWPKRFWIRGLVGASSLIVWGQLSTLFVVHMPGYVLAHHLWIWVLSFGVAAAVLVCLAYQAARRLFVQLKGRESGANTTSH